ncbi:MAG: hypothetical protein ABIP79_06075 [Chitinophagaceae bacterium]
MKKLILPAFGLFTCLLFSCKSKETTTATPQNNDFIVSMNGIDSLKLGMSKDGLEKLLNTKLTLRHITVDGGYSDTFSTKYKGIDMVLYLKEGNEQSIAELDGIRTNSPLCKTASGNGVGSDKINVIDSYPDNTKYVTPEYEVEPVRSTTKSVIAVIDTAGSRAMQFHIVNKKVVSVEVNSYYEFY